MKWRNSSRNKANSPDYAVEVGIEDYSQRLSDKVEEQSSQIVFAPGFNVEKLLVIIRSMTSHSRFRLIVLKRYTVYSC